MTPWKRDPSAPPAPEPPGTHRLGKVDVCDFCASPELEWVKCKLICRNCRQINKTCADL